MEKFPKLSSTGIYPSITPPPSFKKKIYLSIQTIKNFPDFALDFFGFIKDKDYLLQVKNGLSFLCRGGSTDAAEVVIINSNFEYPHHYLPTSKNPVIIDVGANIGAFSIYAAHIMQNPHAQFYALEPQSDNFSYLQKNITLNNMTKQISTFNLALGSQDGDGVLSISEHADSHHLQDETTTGNTQKVTVQTIKTFAHHQRLTHLDLVKMDIEGGEYAIFYDADSMNFLRKNVQTIFIEVHDLDDRHRNFAHFKQEVVRHGFQILAIIANRTLILQNKRVFLIPQLQTSSKTIKAFTFERNY